jgi:membrane associated rhomboid family serine protease
MSLPDEADLPVWQRERIFPVKHEEAPYGVLIGRGKAITFENLDSLRDYLAKWREPAGLIWTPERERCFPPEEEASLLHPLRKRKAAQAESDWNAYRFRAFLLSLPALYFVWSAAASGRLLHSQGLGIMAVLWTIFAGIPAYEAWKRRKRAAKLSAENLADEAQEVRFEIWLRRQNIPATKLILGLLIGVYLVQVLRGMTAGGGLFSSLFFPVESWNDTKSLAGLASAGLVKSSLGQATIGYFHGEWWRLLTGPLLHGQLIHIGMNGLGLLYLGRRAEVMAGWPHLSLVFLLSMIGGGMASVYGLPTQASVGASGGIMGLLGFLLVFERLHGRLVPRQATRRLLAALVFTFVVGFVGYSLIDNWAHGGGLLVGMIYAAIAYPSSSSPHRPQANRIDRVLGVLAAMVTIASGIFAVMKMRGL